MIVDISVDRHGIDVTYTGTMYLKGYDSLCIAWNTISDIDFYDSTGSYAYYFDTRPNYFTEYDNSQNQINRSTASQVQRRMIFNIQTII